MEIRVNGKPRTMPARAIVADLVEGDGKGVAIAVNGEVVRRVDWNCTLLAEHDDIEIVKAVQGG